MFPRLKCAARRVLRDAPGRRFTNHCRRQSDPTPWTRQALLTVAGGTLVAVGFVLCFLPGPGLATMLAGLALLSGRSPWLARRMDRAEIVMWRTLKRLLKR